MNKRLRETRMKFNLTQKEFAQLLNVRTSDIKLMEAGRERIPDSVFKILETKLGVNLEWLRTGILK
ncbi:MAG: helix-turn-helix domain-containing protein [Sarcina sp.]